jgi:hypothetical protein
VWPWNIHTCNEGPSSLYGSGLVHLDIEPHNSELKLMLYLATGLPNHRYILTLWCQSSSAATISALHLTTMTMPRSYSWVTLALQEELTTSRSTTGKS